MEKGQGYIAIDDLRGILGELGEYMDQNEVCKDYY